jgi:hypothetical protein
MTRNSAIIKFPDDLSDDFEDWEVDCELKEKEDHRQG